MAAMTKWLDNVENWAAVVLKKFLRRSLAENNLPLQHLCIQAGTRWAEWNISLNASPHWYMSNKFDFTTFWYTNLSIFGAHWTHSHHTTLINESTAPCGTTFKICMRTYIRRNTDVRGNE
jgi:hypothetical protein